jgi:hypothetical protein
MQLETYDAFSQERVTSGRLGLELQDCSVVVAV